MSFSQAFSFYYQTVLDATSFIAYFLVSMGLCLLIWPKTFNKKEILKPVLVFVISYGAFILFSSLMFATSNVIPNRYLSQIFYALTLPVIVGVFTLIFFRGRALHVYIKIVVLVSSIAVIEALSKNSGFFFGTYTNIKALLVLARSIPYVLFPGVCYLLMRVDINHYRNLSKEMVTILSVLSTLLIVASIYEQASMSQEVATVALLSLLDIVLLFVLNFSYYATYKNIEHRHRITNLEVQKTLEDAERMSIAIDKTNREELEKLRHDMKNQLSYVEILIKQGKNEETTKYIDEYINSSSDVLNSFSCSNNVINSIINLELTKAKISKIKVDVKVVVPPLLPFKDNDLVSLITNMIDNAIENYHSEKEDKIIVRIIKQNDFIRFIVSNPIDTTKVNLKNLTKTSKAGRGHGYGTKIIKNIASSYNGYVHFGVEGDRFVCDTVLDLNVKE